MPDVTHGERSPRPGPGGPAVATGGAPAHPGAPRPAAPRPGAPRPAPAARPVAPDAVAAPAPEGGQAATGLPGGAADAEVAQALADLALTSADAPPLEQAAALERVQERLARRLSGTAR